MAKRHRDEIVLARWVVDGASLRDFVREARLRYQGSDSSPDPLLKECDERAIDGIEVAFREDAFFVGHWDFDFDYNGFSEVQVHETWMQFLNYEEGYEIPVPIARGAKADAERIAKHYLWMRAEVVRRAKEERARPTWNNHLLNIAEAHFIWVVLGFFFVLLPLFVLLLTLFRGGLSG